MNRAIPVVQPDFLVQDGMTKHYGEGSLSRVDLPLQARGIRAV